MRRASLWGLALLLAACQRPVHETPADGVELTVLTYNIHHGEGTDGVFDLERLAAVIRDSGADLVALQEVDVRTQRASGVDQAAELARLTGMEVRFGEAIPYSGGSYGDAVLSSLPIQAEAVWKLPAEPNHEERVAVGVMVELANGARIRFISTHLDHTRDPSDRVRQAQSIMEQAFPPGKQAPPTLLLGDMNAEPGSAPMKVFEELFTSAAPDGVLSYPSDRPERAIDWVLFTPAGAWEVVEVHALDEPVASDHAPVRAVLRYKPPR
jgi:endonuclease/exonuclease/phosphatase family metal-dependent hydrolase